ncbi:MAG: S9 family peptidase [Micromonosporaceae bacterium]|jgi:oligopeptidase B
MTEPPRAKRVPRERTYHGDTVIDEYAWLADRDDPDTLAYLEAENAYTAAATAHLADLRETIFNEIRERTQETDLSVPVRRGDHWYYVRTVKGQQYGIWCRRAVRPGETDPPDTGDGSPLPGEEILLDGNELAAGHEFFAVGTFEVSPDGRWLAYAVDYAGNERFTLRIKDLSTGEVLPDEIPDTHYGVAWSLDASTLFYLTVDEAWRPHRVWRHRVGAPVASDEVVYEETDERFWVGVSLTRSRRYILIDSHSSVTSEVRVLPADDPVATPRVVAPRRQGVEYHVEDDATNDRFLILHNDGAADFALATTPASDPGRWQPLIDHTPGTRLEGVDAFADHIVVSLRRDGLTALRVLPLAGGEPYEIGFPEPLYRVGLDTNPEYATGSVRLRYTSMVTPVSIYDYDLQRRELILRKRTPVLGGYDPEAYEQQREWALADDGARVPISLVYRKGTPRDGSAPCVLYGYGSYEASMDPWFAIPRLSLLDRGVIFAVAHVRGGGELGRRWYEDGKLLAKRNTFTDFIACARHLAKTGWTSPDRTVARGGSAGGLLMGAVANMAPEEFAGIVAEVPFVDPLNSMLDPSLPLTVTEWEEWGNPLESAEVYAYMKSYAPYENVADRPYPPILAVTSLNDTRVLYHEPAKWIAKLRALAPGGFYLLKTEMGAGHGGRSGRYDAWREEAFVLAWILDRLGLAGR